MDKFEESVQLSIVPESNSSGNDPSAPLASWDFIDINMVKKEFEEMEVEVDSPIFPAVERSFNDFDLVNKESMLLENELKEEIVIKEETITSEISRASPPKLDSSTNYDMSTSLFYDRTKSYTIQQSLQYKSDIEDSDIEEDIVDKYYIPNIINLQDLQLWSSANSNNFKWNQSSTKALINLWGKFYTKLQAANKKSALYKNMTRRFCKEQKIVPEIHASVLVQKISNLKRKYREEKMKSSTGYSQSNWFAYDLMRNILELEAPHSESLHRSTANDDASTVSIYVNKGVQVNLSADESMQLSETPVPENTISLIQSNSDFSPKPSKKMRTQFSQNLIKMTATLIPLLKNHIDLMYCSDDEDTDEDSTLMTPLLCTNLLHLMLTQLSTKNISDRSIWSRTKNCDWYDSILPSMSDVEFKEHFHLSRFSVEFLVNELGPFISKIDTTMRKSIPVKKRILVGLYYLATYAEYTTVSSLFGIGKSTTHCIIHEFVDLVNRYLFPKFVIFPDSKESLNEKVEEFEAKSNIPQCIGVIQGCHIHISVPKSQSRRQYSNNQNWLSIVLFALVDAKYRYTFINVEYPGSTEDSYILSNCSLNNILQSDFLDSVTREINGVKVPSYILADSAFPLSRHVQTPIPEHNLLDSEEKCHYNDVMSDARQIADITFQRSKARFRVLYKRIDSKIEFSYSIIKACCVLHNVCESLNDSCPSEWLNECAVYDHMIDMNVKRMPVPDDGGISEKDIQSALVSYIFARNNLQ